MKILPILVLVPLCASAEIYKCVENGKTVFSDVPCGNNQTLIQIDTEVKNGYQLSNPKLEKLADDMQSDRVRHELETQIERQLQKIEEIESDYLKNSARLESELREHKAAKNDYKWSGSEAKRNNYRKRLNELNDELSETKRKYRSDRRLAYIELAQLKEKQRNQR